MPARPHYLPVALGWAWFTFVMTAMIGLYFLRLRGWWLGGPGLLGLLLVVSYTPLLNRHPWLCLLAPGIGFGPVLVVGSSLAVTGQIPPGSVWIAALMALLVSGLLLANQQPDAAVDARFGRRHLAIAYGQDAVCRVLLLCWCLPLPLLLLAVMAGSLPARTLVAATPLLLALLNARQLWQTRLPATLLARNVLVCLATPLLLVVALLPSA